MLSLLSSFFMGDSKALPEVEDLMSIYPIAWIGKRCSNFDEAGELYFVGEFNSFSSSLSSMVLEKNDESRRNFLVSHLIVAFVDRGYLLRFGLLALGKQNNLVDRNRVTLLKGVEIKLDRLYDSPFYLVRSTTRESLIFSVVMSVRVFNTLKFELDNTDIENSKILILESARCESLIDSENSSRLFHPIKGSEGRYECLRHELEQLSLISMHVEKKCLVETFDELVLQLPDENGEFKFIFHTYTHDKRGYPIDCLALLDCSFRKDKKKHKIITLNKMIDNQFENIGMFNFNENPKQFPLRNVSIVGGELLDVIEVAENYILLLLKQRKHKQSSKNGKKYGAYFGDGLTWMILDLKYRILNKIEPIPSCSNVSIDGNLHNRGTPDYSISRNNFTSCLLKPFIFNPELFQIILFKKMDKQSASQEGSYGHIHTLNFKVQCLSPKITFLTSFLDISFKCHS